MNNSAAYFKKIPKRWKVNLIFTIVILSLLIYTFVGSQINWSRLTTVYYSIKWMLMGYTKINPEFLLGYGVYPFSEGLTYLALQTLAIAFIGTIIGAILAVPFGFLSSQTIAGKHLSKIGISILVVIRVFPEIILAIILIKGFGPTPFACVIAIGLHSIGMLGKLFADAIDNMDKSPLEALDAVGANGIQKIRYGIVPQIIADMSSITLYRLDINLRSATVLAVVGTQAVGLGALVFFASSQQDPITLATLMVVIVPLILIMDTISSYLRSKLI